MAAADTYIGPAVARTRLANLIFGISNSEDFISSSASSTNAIGNLNGTRIVVNIEGIPQKITTNLHLGWV